MMVVVVMIRGGMAQALLGGRLVRDNAMLAVENAEDANLNPKNKARDEVIRMPL